MKTKVIIVAVALLLLSLGTYFFAPRWNPDGISAPVNFLRRAAKQKLQSLESEGESNSLAKPLLIHIKKDGSRIGTLLILPRKGLGASIIIIDANGRGEIVYPEGGLDPLVDVEEQILEK